MPKSRSLKILAENMRRIRKIRRLTQEELAYKTGLHPYFIGLIERMQRTPSLESLEKIADALKVTVPEILSESAAAGSKDLRMALMAEIAGTLEPLKKEKEAAVLSALRLIVKNYDKKITPVRKNDRKQNK